MSLDLRGTPVQDNVTRNDCTSERTLTMGISAAMTPKERKQILKGLLDQGAVVHREGKRGTILHLKDGKHFNVPVGTSDYKARLAMRAEVKRAGYHWPLDPPEKKETIDVTPPLEQASATNDLMPASVATSTALPTRESYEGMLPYLTEFADRKFWTSELQDRIPSSVPGFRNKSAGNVKCQQMLWFSGFRPFERKVNRNGFSYHWERPAGAEWPTKFAPTAAEKMRSIIAQQAADRAAAKEAPQPEPQPAPEPQIEVEPVTVESDDDIELTLAAEQETRAIRAEREVSQLRLSLEAEKRAAAQSRRDFMIRIAGWERRSANLEKEIDRLRSMLTEERAEREEGVVLDGSTAMRRAHQAEQTVQSLQHDVEDLTKRLRETEDELNAARAVQPPAIRSALDDGWWPLEPQGKQTMAETMEGAKVFGLEVRVQARRSAK